LQESHTKPYRLRYENLIQSHIARLRYENLIQSHIARLRYENLIQSHIDYVTRFSYFMDIVRPMYNIYIIIIMVNADYAK
jgi:hypothetical protein